MDFKLTEEQQVLIRTVRDFTEKEIAPYTEQWEEQEIFPPREIFLQLGEMGFMGMLVPEEYGGSELTCLTTTLLLEEMSIYGGVVAGAIAVHNMVSSLVYKFGNPEQRQRWLPAMTSGEKLGGFCLTEPNAGSDAAAIETAARRENGEYVINGTKVFITNGGEADLYTVMAKTDKSRGSAGVSCLVAEKGAPGLLFGKKEQKLAGNSSPAREVIFDDCRVSEDNLLGQEGEGFKYAMQVLDGGRVSTGITQLGIAHAAYREAAKYAQQRIQFGKPISSFQAIQFMLADMYIKIEAARLLLYQAASRIDDGLRANKEAAAAKCFSTDITMDVAVDAVQVFGGYGYIKDYPVEGYLRAAKLGQIVEGTNQIQRIVIAREIEKDFSS